MSSSCVTALNNVLIWLANIEFAEQQQQHNEKTETNTITNRVALIDNIHDYCKYGRAHMTVKSGIYIVNRKREVIRSYDNYIHRLEYEMMIKVHNILKEHDIEYWLIGGTLLGAVRTGTILPWDDDTDIGFCKSQTVKLVALESVFNQADLAVEHRYWGIKLTPMKSDECIWQPMPSDATKKYAFPTCDLFEYELKPKPKSMMNKQMPITDQKASQLQLQSQSQKNEISGKNICVINNENEDENKDENNQEKKEENEEKIWWMAHETSRGRWPNAWFHEKDVWPLKEYVFGKCRFWGPNSHHRFCSRMFGVEYMTKGMTQVWNHLHRKSIDAVFFDIIYDDDDDDDEDDAIAN
jgi:phosphorylcholine metabolism protein LicD